MNKECVFGWHAVEALLNNPKRSIIKIYLSCSKHNKKPQTNKKLQTILDIANAKNISIENLTSKAMDLQFPNCVHQGIVAYAQSLLCYHEQDLISLLNKAKNPPLFLILDEITDPHNLGACLRTAEAAAVDCVIIPKDKSATITPTVSKIASGAAESIPLVRVTNLVRTLDKLKEKGIWIYGADVTAEQSLYSINCKYPLAIVMGSENKGLRRLTKEHCDNLFSLPMLGNIQSLNVSVATGIALYEIIRQRTFA
jgi:23S rRNA (guanosine2251-2'-O)-methyltransferase